MASVIKELIEKSASTDWLFTGVDSIWELNPFRRDLKLSASAEPTVQSLRVAIESRSSHSSENSLFELSLENLWLSQFLIDEITESIKRLAVKPHQSLEFLLVHVMAELESSLSLALEVFAAYGGSAVLGVDNLYLTTLDLLSEVQKLLNAATATGALQGELGLFFSALGVLHEFNRDRLSNEGGFAVVSQRVALALGLTSSET